MRWASVDETFFDSWRPEMAWVLGLLFTDGSIRAAAPGAAARLTFSQKSNELPEKLRALLRSNTVIHHCPRRTYNGKTAGAVYRFQICNRHLCERLLALGLIPRKSLTLAFPSMPEDCVRHFVRGCWDGDGSVQRVRTRSGETLRVSFGSGSQAFIHGMLAQLYAGVGLRARTVYQLRRRGALVEYYYFVFQGDGTERLYRFLYEDVEDALCLSRKRAAFEEHFARGVPDTR